jgi:hypothetical protein
MRVGRFCGCHKTATVGGCFSLHCFSVSFSVWCKGFSPLAQNGSVLKPPRCVYGRVCGLNFSPQESSDSAIQSGTSMDHSANLTHPPSKALQADKPEKQTADKNPHEIYQFINKFTDKPISNGRRRSCCCCCCYFML